jgi:hypothetical protein
MGSEATNSEHCAITTYGPGHVVLSRRPEDVQAALQEVWRPMLEQLVEAQRINRWWWALARRHRSRIVTRRKQRRTW